MDVQTLRGKFQLIPREQAFFPLFDKDVDNLVKAAAVLKRAFGGVADIDETARTMKELEHEGDRITHEIYALCHRTFITPFDREDIHELAVRLDDVLDYMEAVTERLRAFRIGSVQGPARQIVRVIVKQVEEIRQIVPDLRDPRNHGILARCIEINRLENEADQLADSAVADLFAGGAGPLEIIKWRELYDLLETATDKCEDVADAVQTIVLKNG
jgi:uncharacterized protein